MEMELKIVEIAKEYKENRDAFMRVRPKTRKKIHAFEKYLFESRLSKSNIIASEKKYFDFCDFCKEIMFFRCYDFNFSLGVHYPLSMRKSIKR